MFERHSSWVFHLYIRWQITYGAGNSEEVSITNYERQCKLYRKSFCIVSPQGANEGGKNYGDEYLAELDYVEVVEGIKEGYESDVLEPEMPLSPPEEDKNKSMTSDDEDNAKANGSDSDEDFDIRKYVSYNLESTSTEPSSIR